MLEIGDTMILKLWMVDGEFRSGDYDFQDAMFRMSAAAATGKLAAWALYATASDVCAGKTR